MKKAKKSLGVLVSAMMVLNMIPAFPVIPAAAEEDAGVIALEFSEFTAPAGEVSNDMQMKAALGDSTNFTVKDGEFVLEKNLKLETKLVLKSGYKAVLNLNGHTIQAEDEESMFELAYGSELTVKNGSVLGCSYNAPDDKNGGGFNVYGTLTLEDVTVSGHGCSEWGGGIAVQPNGTLYLKGSTAIINNYAGEGGGGVCLWDKTSRMYVEGTCRIENNMKSGKKESNVYLSRNTHIDVSGALDTESNIGITAYTGNFTSGFGENNTEDPTEYFFLDNGTKGLIAKDGEAAYAISYEECSWDEEEQRVVSTTKILDKYYSLSDVLEYASNGSNYWTNLIADHYGDNLSDPLWLVVDKDISIDDVLICKYDVRLVVCDDCTLTCDEGIECDTENDGSRINKLTIYGQTKGNGKIVSHAYDGAGIGGPDGKAGGDITIHGGTIEAYGNDGAGIGGGDDKNGGTITIYDGNIYAKGDTYDAGIGGGEDGSSGMITIYGGEVEAYGGTDAAGIGGGEDGAGANIIIKGGVVKAYGNDCGAGIGGGQNGSSGTITITGGEIIATGNDEGAGIGGGDLGKGGNITITGGDVTAKAVHGAAIGSGQGGDMVGTIRIDGGTVTAVSEDGAGIGSGDSAYMVGSILITDGTVWAESEYGAGIGTGQKGSSDQEKPGGLFKNGSSVIITGGTVEAFSAHRSGSTKEYESESIGHGYWGTEPKHIVKKSSGTEIHDVPESNFQTITIGNTLTASSGDTKDAATLQDTGKRYDALTSAYVKLEPCAEHTIVYDQKDPETHNKHCKHCTQSEIENHHFSPDVKWTWGVGHLKATAVFTCDDCGYSKSVSASVKRSSENGHTTCTATATFEGREYQDIWTDGEVVTDFVTAPGSKVTNDTQMKAALGDASNFRYVDGEFVLYKDIEFDSQFTIDGSYAPVLNLNGHTIRKKDSGTVFSIASGAGLTVRNGSVQGTRTITENDVYGAFNTSGTLTLEDVRITDFGCIEYGGGVAVQANGTLYLKGNTVITGNTADKGGGVALCDKTAKMFVEGSCQIQNNDSLRHNESNVYMKNQAHIGFSGALSEGASIGITGSDGTITTGYSASQTADPADYFFVDGGLGSIAERNGEAKILYTYEECSWDAENKKVVTTTKTVEDYIVLEDYTGTDNLKTSSLSAGANTIWLVVNNDTRIGEDEYLNEVALECEYNVNLLLCDYTNLDCPGGIICEDGNSLTIYGQSKNAGSLQADEMTETYSAAIGGRTQGACGDITIHGGNISAKSFRGAGIGGGGSGLWHADNTNTGVITIYGGRVYASSDNHAAGIGGGEDGGTMEKFVMYGGNVTAIGGKYAAGIGGGEEGSGGEILIEGGELYAEGGTDAAGIGGGEGGNGGWITINGGIINAHGGTLGAGIGGGEDGNGGQITINGGDIMADSLTDGAGIGGGEEGTGGKIVINGGNIQAASGGYGAGIGGGDAAEGGSITINGGKVTATAGVDAAGIGGGEDGSGGTITINGGTIQATGGENGAGIGGGEAGDSGTIVIKNGDITANATDGAAIGNGSNCNPMKGSVTVKGGSIEAVSQYGAGIGSAYGSDMEGSVAITGGTVYARSKKGAGIGAGRRAWDDYSKDYYGGNFRGTISISDGTVDAASTDADSYDLKKTGQAIGHGLWDDDSTYNETGKLTIADGLKVTAGNAEDAMTDSKADARSAASHSPYAKIMHCTDHVYSDAKCTYCNSLHDAENVSFLTGTSLSLTGQIGAIIVVKPAANLDVKTAYVTVQGPNDSKPVKHLLSELQYIEEENEYYIESMLNAREMGKSVNVHLYDGSGKEQVLYNEHSSKAFERGFTYSPLDYFSGASEQYADKQVILDLIAAMQNYGEYAREYFGESDPKICDPDQSAIDDISASDLEQYRSVKSGTLLEGIEYRGTALLLKSQTALRFYFNTDPGKFTLTDAKNNAVTCTTGTEEGMFYIEVDDIAPEFLDKTYTVSIGDYKITASAMTFAYNTLYNYSGKRDKTALCNLAKALYNYHITSVAYYNAAWGDQWKD